MEAFHIGNISIHRYGIFYLIGFTVWYLFLKYIGNKRIFEKRPQLQNLLEKGSEDIMLYCVTGVLIGGRLGHIFIYDFDYYLQHPGDIIAIWKWGMSFIGGMIGIAMAFLALKKIKKLNRTELIMLLDCILCIVPFGIMLGRIGNFLNQELYGILAGPLLPRLGYPLFSIFHDLRLFHVYPQVDEFLRVNTNFLASFFEGFVLLIITLTVFHKTYAKKRYHAGLITWIFLLYYSAVRFALEYLRADSQLEFIGPFTKSQRFFIAFFLLGIIIFYKSFTWNSSSSWSRP